MSQYDLCYGEPGSSGAILLTLNKKDEADKLCSAINKADVFQGGTCEASVREVERDGPVEEPKAPKAPRAPRPRARVRKKEDKPDGEGIG